MECKLTSSPPRLGVEQWLDLTQDAAEIIAWDSHHCITRAELRQDVRRLYSQLRSLPDQRIALCFDDHYFFLVALLACLYAGKVPVLLGHKKPARFIEQHHCFDRLLSDSSIALIKGVQQLSLARLLSDAVELHALPALNMAQTLELYTSGSTGQPKKVVKNLVMMEAEIDLVSPLFTRRVADCRLVASVPPFHLYGLTFSLWLPLSFNLPIARQILIYPEQYAALSGQFRYMFVSSPAFLNRLDSDLCAPETAMVISAGGHLNDHAVEHTLRWLKIGIDEIYGSSETGIIAHRFRHRTSPPWQSFPGITFTVCPQGWQISSPLLDQLTPIALQDELVFIDSNHFQLNGRQSRLIKLEEKRVSLDELEQRILQLKGVIDVAVIQIVRHQRPRLAALVVISPQLATAWPHQRQSIERQWRFELNQYVEGIAIPRYWKRVDAIPTNDLNKRQEAQLQELFFETV